MAHPKMVTIFTTEVRSWSKVLKRY